MEAGGGGGTPRLYAAPVPVSPGNYSDLGIAKVL